MGLNFEKYAAEGNEFINELSRNLGHENSKAQVGFALRAVLHELRNCISVPQSIHLLAQLPMFLKALYVEQWKVSDMPCRIKTLHDFATKVEEEQRRFGERSFDWNESTIDIVKTILNTLINKYITEGQVEELRAELGGELKELLPMPEKLKV